MSDSIFRDWKERERWKQDHCRTLPLWIQENFWAYHPEIYKNHFVHVSINDPKLLAYTESEEKGSLDIQTPIKPGRYLTKYFSEILSEKQIQEYARYQTLGPTAINPDLKFAYSAEEIVDVYHRGPYSCMRDFNKRNHPCQVYAAGDLAIAYLKTNNTVIARALVWPAHKIYGRVYPTPCNWQEDRYESHEESEKIHNKLHDLLKTNGYKKDSCNDFANAKLLKIKHDNGYLMPYLDKRYSVTLDNDYFIISRNGDVRADSLEGYILLIPKSNCDYCGGAAYNDDLYKIIETIKRGQATSFNSVCETCRDKNTFYCNGLNEYVSSENCESVEVHKMGSVSESWAEEFCNWSDFSEKWYYNHKMVDMENGETWTEDEFDTDGFVCKITGACYSCNDMHPEHDNVYKNVDEEDLEEYCKNHKIPFQSSLSV